MKTYEYMQNNSYLMKKNKRQQNVAKIADRSKTK